MAIYHLSAKPVRRSAGRSATAAAAYRAGTEIADQRTGQTFDYTRKQGIEHTEIVLPSSAARQDINWPRDRAALWNAAELAENRKDSRVAREYEIALPAELDAEQRKELTREFAKDIANRYGGAVDIAIHSPHRDGDQRNHHAHLLATTRQITPDGLGRKTSIELSDTDRKKRGMGPAATELEAIRQRWADMSNQALERHGHSARIDYRTLSAQREEAKQKGDDKQAAELDREPTKHLGPSATAMERRGKSTDLGDINRRIAEAAESGRLQRERQATDRSILDLSGDLATAIRDRDALRSIQPDSPMVLEARRQAREAWGEIRAAGKEAKEQLGLWKEAREQEARKQEAQRQAPHRPGFQRDGQQRDGPARVGTGKIDPNKAPTLGGFKIDRSLLDRVNAMGGRAADPHELERLLREWMQHQQQEKEQREERERGERQAGAGRRPPDPHDKRTQQERDRENDHRRHRDRGFER